MRIFPQLLTGATAPEQVTRRRVANSVVTRNSSGYLKASAGESTGQVEWDMRFRSLTKSEWVALETFYDESEGPLLPFVFLDPLMNLLRWTEDLTQSIWVVSGGVTVTPTSDGYLIVNNGAGSGGVAQQVAIDATPVCCFSGEFRTLGPASQVTLSRSAAGLSSHGRVGSNWEEVLLTGSGNGDGPETFAISIPAGSSVEVRGLQLEAQPAPGEATLSQGRSGVFEEAYFVDGSLDVTVRGLDEYDVRVLVESAW